MDLGLEIDRRAADWLDKSWLPRGDEISLQQLLTYTSGLSDYFDVSNYHTGVKAGGQPWSDAVGAQHTLRQPIFSTLDRGGPIQTPAIEC